MLVEKVTEILDNLLQEPCCFYFLTWKYQHWKWFSDVYTKI